MLVCLCVCLACFGAQMSPPGWEKPSKRSCCILLFCFPLFNCSGTQLAGEQTQRSVAGHGPVYSQHELFVHVCVTLGSHPCKTGVCVDSGSIAYLSPPVKRDRTPLFIALQKSFAACCLSIASSHEETTRSRSLTPKRGQSTRTR